jgi:hypothetical protein
VVEPKEEAIWVYYGRSTRQLVNLPAGIYKPRPSPCTVSRPWKSASFPLSSPASYTKFTLPGDLLIKFSRVSTS